MHRPIDKVISLDDTAVQKLKNTELSSCVIFPNSFRSAYLPWRAKLPGRRGVPGAGRGLLLNEKVKHAAEVEKKHQAYEYFSLLGIEAPEKIPNPSLLQLNEGNRQGIAFIPGSARGPSKQWPKEKFIELGLSLMENTDEHILLLGTENEGPLCREIKDAIGQDTRIRNLAGQTSLKELAQNLSKCKAAIVNDSGGMHLASAVNTPLIAIYGITDPEKTGPLGKKSIVLQKSETRARDLPRVSAEAEEALKRVNADEVLKELMQLL